METLLDSLPDDVYPKIAQLIKGTTHAYRKALSFAAGSETRRQAVIEAFSGHLVLRVKDKEFFTAFIAMFGDKLYSLCLNCDNNQKMIANIPNLPNLRQAVIAANPEQLSIIRGGAFLKKLAIYAYPNTSWDALVDTCASLPAFNHLRLHVHHRLKVPPAAVQEQLAEALSGIEQLHLRGSYNSFHHYWHMILKLRSLTIISLYGSAKTEHVPFLRKLRDVRLMAATSTKRASEIGRNVTMLTQGISESAEGLVRLRHCPNLRVFHGALENGAELGLWDRVSKLESLQVWWGAPDVLCPPAWDRDYRYYRPNGNFLVSLAHRAKKVRRLGFVGARITGRDISRILRQLNHRLEEFRVHLDNQDEPKPRRLIIILISLCCYCPNIRKLEILGLGPEVVVKGVDILKCTAVVTELRRRCPALNTKKIQDYIYRFRLTPMKRTRDEIVDG